MNTTTKPMTEAQFNYAISLTEEVFATDPTKRLEMLLQVAGCDFHSISTWIDFLKTLKPHVAKTASTAPAAAWTVPAYIPPDGHYVLSGGQHVQVKTSKSTKAAYFYVGGGYAGAVGNPKNAGKLAQLDTPEKAMAASIAYAGYTKEHYGVAKCGVCNTKLKDPKSIAAGIGPVCAKKYGK